MPSRRSRGQPQRGRIEVSITQRSRTRDSVWISITDNGEGIAAGLLPALFQRGISSRHARKGGLGLHWCANAVKLLGGSIHAESDGPGRGTTIIIELPHLEPSQREAA